MLGVLAEHSPQPKIEQPILIDPDVVRLGEWVTVRLRATNYGFRADEMYISVSLPENPPLENIEIIDSDLQATYVLGPGDKVWGDYGQTYPIILQYPLVEGYTLGWENGQTKYLKFKFRPHRTGTFKLYVKTTAQTGGIWKYDPASGTKDQQNEFVYVYSVKVLYETIIFFDDFESYAVGTFPSAGGWELIWNGRGNEYQCITDKYWHSPIKSLQLWGKDWWSAHVQKKFSSDSTLLGFEAYVLVESYTSKPSGSPVSAVIGFWNKEAATWGLGYAWVQFTYDGNITTNDVWAPTLGTWTPKTWYKVKLILDRSTNTFDVWINGELVGNDIEVLPDRQNTYNIKCFNVGI
ncbi:MAG: hypothetical protein QXR45_15785 [Candidatus Bathyarchaeia archaeon]